MIRFTPQIPTVVAVSTGARTVRGLVLPYGVPGATSAGRVTVRPGALKIPTDPTRVKLLDDHRPTGKPVGYLDAVDDTDTGMMASFRLGSGAAADAALTAADEHTVDGLSVELVDVQRQGNEIVSATLAAVALVAIPAFDAARVDAVTTTTEEQEPTMPENTAPPAPSTEPVTDPAAGAGQKQAGTTDPAPAVEVSAAAAPDSLVTTRPRPVALTAASVVETLAAVRAGERTPEITAALVDITRSANPSISPPQWLGEIWSGNDADRLIIPKFTRKTLTGLKAKGWKWTTKPVVAPYVGDKSAVPSSPVATDPVELTAQRWANANDIDRAYFDFNETEFINEYWRANANSYAVETDDAFAAVVIAAATPVLDADGVTPTVAPSVLHAAAIGAQKVKNTVRTPATVVMVNSADNLKLLDLSALEQPQYARLFGPAADPANWVVTDLVPAGTVVVATGRAATFFELGGSPIRVNTVDLANGGNDLGVFGYSANMVNHAAGIVSVQIAP